jgi:hypothetical protein
METTGFTTDTFYEDRYKQLKNILFIGDDTHMGGIGLADMQLERLFDESLDAESVLRRIGQKYDQQKKLIKQGGLFPLKITENTTFNKTHYLLVDNDNKLRIGEWDKEKHQFFEINGHQPIDNDSIKAYFTMVNPCAGNDFGVSIIDILYK